MTSSPHVPRPPCRTPVAFFPLFCTADVPAETLNALVKHEGAPPDKYENIWVLVHSPTEKQYVRGLSLVEEGQVVGSDLKTASDMDLENFCVRRFGVDNDENRIADYTFAVQNGIADYMFAVLDERSIRDHTLRMFQWDAELQTDENGETISDDLFVDVWASVRVSFRDASSCFKTLTYKGLIEFKVTSRPPRGEEDVLEPPHPE